MSAAPALRVVSDDGLLVDPRTGEPTEASYRIQDLEDQLAGEKKTGAWQSREIGRLGRQLNALLDPDSQPANSEVVAVVERWRGLCRTEKTVVSKDRIKLVRGRVADGFEITSEEWLPDRPTLELAVDGVASHPFLLYGKRKREGAESNRYDDLKDALGDAAKVEEAARAGYKARKAGWTLEGGWLE